MKGTTIVPDLLISITRLNNQFSLLRSLKAFLYVSAMVLNIFLKAVNGSGCCFGGVRFILAVDNMDAWFFGRLWIYFF
jgi:hypothetical protein